MAMDSLYFCSGDHWRAVIACHQRLGSFLGAGKILSFGGRFDAAIAIGCALHALELWVSQPLLANKRHGCYCWAAYAER